MVAPALKDCKERSYTRPSHKLINECCQTLYNNISLFQLSSNEDIDKHPLRNQISPVSLVDHSVIFSNFQDASVPPPRTSGAKFCSVGKHLFAIQNKFTDDVESIAIVICMNMCHICWIDKLVTVCTPWARCWLSNQHNHELTQLVVPYMGTTSSLAPGAV